MKNFRKLILITLAFSTMIVGCGKSNKSSSENAATTINTPVTQTSTSLAYCNQATTTNTQFNVTVFTENNQVRNDLLRVKFSKIHSAFTTSGTVLQFFRWKAASDGTTSIDTVALPVRVIDLTTNSEIFSANYVRYSDIQAATSTTDLSKFLLIVDIKDVAAEYDVLRTVIYTSAGVVVDNMDALIPAFSANPAEYATKYDGSARAQVLRNLHPFKAQLGSATTTAQFASSAAGYCF